MTQPLRLRCALLVTMLVLAACGGGQADVDEAFHRIQRFEATIANREQAREACVPAEPCPAQTEICNAAAGICNEAGSLGDVDARTRCERAEAQCGRAGASP